MKKILITTVAMAASSVFAQSNVTIYGIADLGVTKGSGSIANITRLNSGNYSSSRLGFKGTEDLGNGLKANFVLEGDVGPDTGLGSTSSNPAANASPNNLTVSSTAGGFTFNRQSTVGLSGNFGEVRLGRDYTPSFLVDAIVDPFGLNGVGANAIFGRGNAESSSTNHLRASNSISYSLPQNLNGFSGQVMYAIGENPTGTTPATIAAQKDGQYIGANIGYANGPLTLLAAAANFNLSTVGNVQTSSVGATYKFDVVTASAEYSADKKGAAAFNNKAAGTLLGLSAPVGNGLIRASYVSRKVTQDNVTTNNQLNQASIGYVHNLSKRTLMYATYSNLSNKGLSAVAVGGSSTAAGTKSSGFDLGMRHAF